MTSFDEFFPLGQKTNLPKVKMYDANKHIAKLEADFAVVEQHLLQCIKDHKARITQLEMVLRNISLCSHSTLGGSSTDLGRMARKALDET